MAYLLDADIENRIPTATVIQLTDHEHLVIDPENTTLAAAIVLNADIRGRIDAAIDDAESDVSIYLRKRYTLPASGDVPAAARRWALALAIFNLHSQRASELGIPDGIKRRYDNAVKALERVAKGDLDLGDEPPRADSAAVLADAQGPDLLFTDDNTSRF